MRLSEIYAHRVAGGMLEDDPAQRAVLPVLEDIRSHLERASAPRRGILGGLFHKPEAVPQGLYLWGGVGRGKSMLMDMFVEALAITGKRRVHFHEFMQEVHEALERARARQEADAIAPVAAGIADGLRLLALDEMQISDIADAMIVGRLFERLFDLGVVVVTTSNRPPEDLYKDGLNRQLFLPFIELLRTRMVIHELVSPQDYRQRALAGSRRWLSPDDGTARREIDRMWQDLTGGASAPLTLRVKGREVILPAFHDGVARARFHDLCGVPLGPADYLALADVVRFLFLENIPLLGRDNYNEARRFVTLTDALYEARTGLAASAAARPEMLYTEGEGSFEFDRTASRLQEMTREDWGQPARA